MRNVKTHNILTGSLIDLGTKVAFLKFEHSLGTVKNRAGNPQTLDHVTVNRSGVNVPDTGSAFYPLAMRRSMMFTATAALVFALALAWASAAGASPTPTVTPRPRPITITVQTNLNGLSYTVDGRTYTVAQSFSWLSGSTHILSTTSPQNSGGQQNIWQTWSDNGVISHAIAPTAPTAYTAIFGSEPVNRPPNYDFASAEPAQIWPANHDFVPVAIHGVVDPEGDPFTLTILGITQDEPVHGHGNGNTFPDALGAGDETAQIRAERSDQGNGRVYAISFLARDANGLESTGTVKTSVPEVINAAAIDTGQRYNSIMATAQSLVGSPNNSIVVGNINQNIRPNQFDLKKTIRFSLATKSEVFVKYDLGQSHGCCDDHHIGALRVTLNGQFGQFVLNDAVQYVNYGVIRYLEDFDYFWTANVVRGEVPPVSSDCPLCQPPIPRITGPLLRNYKPSIAYKSLGIRDPGQYEAKLLLGDAGWNNIFEVWASPATSPPIVIDIGEFDHDAPTEWLPTLLPHNPFVDERGGRKVVWTMDGITVTGPTGMLPSQGPTAANTVRKYRFFGSENHLLLLETPTLPGLQDRTVSLVDFSTSPPSQKPILSVSTTSTRALPSVQWSQGTGNAFFIFAPIPDVGDPERSQVTGLAIYRSDNGQPLCAYMGPPFVPTGMLLGERTATQLRIKYAALETNVTPPCPYP